MTTPGFRHIACPHCGTTNRVPRPRLADDPTCGRCGQALLDGHPVELTDANFETVVGKTDLPVLVDFWAPWCGPCRMMGPAFEQAAAQLKGRALLAKVNSDDNPQVAARFGIRIIPTLVRLEGGREVSRHSGALPAGQIVAFAG
jgi:thioredoxin 2